VTRYFLHLRDGTDVALDEEGLEFDTVASLSAGMIANARDLIKGDIGRGLLDLRLRIDAETENGALVTSLPFTDAIEIIYPHEDARQR
jgi:hypothetical protein